MTSATPDVDQNRIRETLLELLSIPSPTGFTDEISRVVCAELQDLGVAHRLTRRGTIIAEIPGRVPHRARAVANHLDTIGAVVTDLKQNGRLALRPIGTWSSRFAEGGRVTVFTRAGNLRGQVLPLLASGHAFNEQVDELEVSWEAVEVRVDEIVKDRSDLRELGVSRGDFVAFDPDPEVAASGFISARHLDNKAGASALLEALRLIQQASRPPELTFRALFTITEEVGTGAGASLTADVEEFVGIDIGPVAPGQNARESGVTLCAQDTSGPFDQHMLRHMRALCTRYDIGHQTDIYRYYYSDANSAIKAGHDVRDALITFGTDATHGYERTHMDSLTSISRLLYHYAFSDPVGGPDFNERD
ncbi:MAG: osmoprotectant NAGGN system M42 family peptidase [Pseudomonadales bacterium]